MFKAWKIEEREGMGVVVVSCGCSFTHSRPRTLKKTG
jgi:hypothetical protein